MGTHFKNLGVGVLETPSYLTTHILLTRGMCLGVSLALAYFPPISFFIFTYKHGSQAFLLTREMCWVPHLPWLISNPLPFDLVMSPKFKSQLCLIPDSH